LSQVTVTSQGAYFRMAGKITRLVVLPAFNSNPRS
jgi:hypothetical protein